MSDYCKTISEKVTLEGINVVKGNKSTISFYPAGEERLGNGIFFIVGGHDIPAGIEYACTVKNWRESRFASLVALRYQNAVAYKVEHLVSALKYGLGIDSLVVELSDGYVPRLAGGVPELMSALKGRTVQTKSDRTYLVLNPDKPMPWEGFSRYRKPDRLTVRRSATFGITSRVSFPHRSIGIQEYSIDYVTDETYRNIIDARAMAFIPSPMPSLVQALMMLTFRTLHGLSPKNALFIKGRLRSRYHNPNYKFRDNGRYEFVCHKMLDELGEIALLPGRLKGMHLTFDCTGHRFDLLALKKMLDQGYLVKEK